MQSDELAISVRDLCKTYTITSSTSRRTTFRDVVMDRIRHPFQRRNREQFSALKDISFDIRQGDIVGLVGRNGAGKSTLLKILSQITEPTAGRVKIFGRVGSLLEVGTGFHPELTGRENIYLNGTILGMRRDEIRARFDEIVSFAEITQFLDTPVKRYSSGMYVRLAFAVAAHLESDILLIDEVLAVGDAQFQQKCLGKMGEVAKGGRTVFLVSHNMNAIETLCNRALFFQAGRLEDSSHDVRGIVQRYLFGQGERDGSSIWINSGNEHANPWFKPLRFSLTDANHFPLVAPPKNDSEIWVEIHGVIASKDPGLTVGYAIYEANGQLLYWSYQTDTARQDWPTLETGSCILRSRLPRRLLNEGRYRIELLGSLHFRQWLFEPGVSSPSVFIEIQGGLSDSPIWMDRRPGILAPVIQWEVEMTR